MALDKGFEALFVYAFRILRNWIRQQGKFKKHHSCATGTTINETITR